MTADEHIKQAEALLRYVETDQQATINPLVGAVSVFKALTHATLAQAIIQRGSPVR